MDQVLPEALQEVAPGAVPEVLPGMLPTGEAFMSQQSLPSAQNPTPASNDAVPVITSAAAAAPAVVNDGISADEIALYDRQIRLWGMQAQEKIRRANVLLITMKALGNEVAKNLVLAGIGSLTILDGDVVTEFNLGSQFFLSAEENHVGQNRAVAAAPAVQRLNPRVAVHADPDRVEAKGTSYFSSFDLVIATDLDPAPLNIINTATRLHQEPFYAAGTHGFYGFIFADLIEHDYVIERELSNIATKIGPESRTRAVVDVQTKTERAGKTVESVTKRELYSTWYLSSEAAQLPDDIARSPRRRKAVPPALSCLRALWQFQSLHAGRLPSHTNEDLALFTKLATAQHAQLGLPSETLRSEFLRSFLQNLGSEIAPVTALIGGQLAQDVINVLGQTQQPIQNTVIFDGNTMEAAVFPLHPPGPLGKELFSVAMGNGAMVDSDATPI
ncbi:hypothetical protein SODALDRAFT_271195 [Sodiomyces alkalinus F11]|uniref:Ubiquitin-like 1-activating enzyme E1A n=1 Tax=Sodiomyces alkalinus (strain CBS 110278 / VKM F-3762 / F11) TaxID=1314773 RepID=A0A3N2Q0T6_SODAK|nr:hypothetical protein SODALDRAFT_271195 [Sodiomyces alkalinus F11]ROT40371.1 hypothetical protein SODALDRAFT_271195 [Sodiomyces alkalinus F11]